MKTSVQKIALLIYTVALLAIVVGAILMSTSWNEDRALKWIAAFSSIIGGAITALVALYISIKQLQPITKQSQQEDRAANEQTRFQLQDIELVASDVEKRYLKQVEELVPIADFERNRIAYGSGGKRHGGRYLMETFYRIAKDETLRDEAIKALRGMKVPTSHMSELEPIRADCFKDVVAVHDRIGELADAAWEHYGVREEPDGTTVFEPGPDDDRTIFVDAIRDAKTHRLEAQVRVELENLRSDLSKLKNVANRLYYDQIQTDSPTRS